MIIVVQTYMYTVFSKFLFDFSIYVGAYFLYQLLPFFFIVL